MALAARQLPVTPDASSRSEEAPRPVGRWLDALRFPIALGCGFLVAGAMFWFLWVLINVKTETQQATTVTKIEFTRLRHDTEAATIKHEKPELKPVVQSPVAPQLARATMARAGSAAVASSLLAPPSIDARGSLGGLSIGQGISLGGSDRDVMPLVRLNPQYPPRALRRGIQGWVLVQFTITPAGTVKDAKVVDAEPKGIFNDAAVKAVSGWKYNPKVENGQPVERRGVQVMLTFKLEK